MIYILRNILIFLFIVWPLIFCDYGSASVSPPNIPLPDQIRFLPLSFEPPYVERKCLENGLRLYIYPDRELPLVKIKVVVRFGSMYDPPGKEGLAELIMATMRTGGTKGMRGDVVDEILDSMAVNFHPSTNQDSCTFSFSVLKKDSDRGFDIFSRILIKPSFEENKLNQCKDQIIEELRRIIDNPSKLAFREFKRLMHEGSTRHRHVTEESIHAVFREDLQQFYRKYFHPRNMMISITGDIGSKEASILVEKHWGMLSSPKEISSIPPLPQPPEGNIYFLIKDIPQSIIILGWAAPSKRDAQYYPFVVLDSIAGSGGFHSRIFQEIRTNLGLAYSTGSFYNAKSDYGYFAAYAFTKAESTIKVTKRISDIIHEMGQKHVSSKELRVSKNTILNSCIFSFTSAEQMVFQKIMIEYDGLPYKNRKS